jgi:PAS domain S-box-containing protein
VYLDIPMASQRIVELAGVGSSSKAGGIVKRALARMPKKTFVLVDAIQPDEKGDTLDRLLRLFRRTSHCVFWLVSRDLLSNQKIASLKDAFAFFLDITSVGSVSIAQFLTARGVYEPEFFLPRPLVIGQDDLLLAYPILPVPVPSPQGNPADAPVPVVDLLEQKYRQVFDASREGMMLLDEATGYREVNDRLCEMVGYARDELRPMQITSLVPSGSSTTSIRRAMVQARRKGKVVCDLRLARKSGRTLDVRVYAARLLDSSYLAIVHDITDEKRSEAHLQRKEAEFRMIVETDPVPRAVFVNRKLVFRNQAFDRAFSWLSAEQRQGLLLHQLLGKKNAGLTKRISALAGSREQEGIPKTRAALESGDGRQVWFEISARPITYGTRLGVQCSFVDVTEEVQSLCRLSESERSYRTLVEQSDEALSVDDGESFIYVNRGFLNLCGIDSPEEVVGKSITTLRTKRHRASTRGEKKRAADGLPEREVYQETLKRKDGSTVEVETERVTITVDGKRLFQTYRRDVSAWRRAELESSQKLSALEYLRKNSTLLHQTLEISDLVRVTLATAKEAAECEAGAVLAVGPDGTSVDVVLHENFPQAVVAALSTMTVSEGLTGLAAKTQEPLLLTLDDYPPHLPYRSLFESETFLAVAVLPVVNDGRLLAVLLLASREPKSWDEEDRLLLSSFVGELGVAYANALHFGRVAEREATYGSAINGARDILYRCTPAGAFIFIGSGIQRIVGYEPEDFIRSAALMRDLVHPDDRTTFSQRISHQAKNVDEFALEYRVLPRGKATYRWVRDALSYERNTSGEVLSLTGLLTDITGSKTLLEDLQKSERLKANILNSVQEGVLVLDTDLHYIDWNRSMETMTGLSRDVVLGRRVGEGMPALVSDGVLEQLQRALRGQAVTSDEMPFPLLADETERFFWTQYAPLQDSLGTIKGVVGIITDVSKRRELEREVRESEETLRNVIDTMGDALMISDLQGRVWEVNREFTRLTGFARKEAQGMEFPYTWVLEEDMAHFVGWIAALREKNYLRDFDMTWKAKDGGHVAISLNTTLLRNAQGEPVAMLNIARDISERRHLTQELERKVRENLELYAQVQAQVQRLTSLYELGKSLTGTLDARTLLDIVRAEVANAIPFDSFTYFTLSPDRLSLVPVYAAQDAEPFYEKHGNRSRSIMLNKGSVLSEVVSNDTSYLGATPDDVFPHDALLAVPMKSRDTVVGVLCLTSAKADAFSESHLRLFESIATLTEIALEKATLYEDTVSKAHEIEERNKELDDFTYVVSHDLKEPLITIEGYSKILLKDYQNVVDKDGSEYLQTVVQSSTHMKRLIDDLLTLSRLGHVREATEVVSSAAVVMEVLQDIQFTLHERGAAVRVSDHLPDVQYSRTQLLIVFRNLITNAIKFNDKPQPTVDVSAKEEGQEYVFAVQDNGIGIEERYFDKIFMIFQRLQRKEEYQGTGAGLTIVKKIVENHHGRVWVSSVLGEGTTILFTIPK